jgi:cytochrome P450
LTAKTAFPATDIDLFSDQHLENPYPDYKSLRDAGPVVHMSRLDVAALARYKPVLTRDWETDGVTILEGSRVMVLFGSGNRDERHYPEPDRELPVTITVR